MEDNRQEIKKNYFSLIADKHRDCKDGWCCHFDCLNKLDSGQCKLKPANEIN